MIQPTFTSRMGISLLAFLSLFASLSNAQNLDSLRSVILDRFPANLTLAIEYSERDFALEPYEVKALDPLNESQLSVLKDSFELTGNPIYLYRLGLLNRRLNHLKKGYEYLYNALDLYYLALEENPTSYKLLCEVIDLHLALDQTDYAIVNTERLLEVYPDNQEHLVSNVSLRLFSNRSAEAHELAESTAKKIPDNAGMLFIQTMSLVQRQMQLIPEAKTLEEAQSSWEEFSLKLNHLQEARENYPDKVDLQVAVLSSELLVFFYGKIIPVMFGGDVGKAGYEFPMTKQEQDKIDFLQREFNGLLKNKSFHNKYVVYYSLGILEILNSRYKKSIPYFEKAISQKKPMYRGAHNTATSCYNNIFAAYAFLDDKDAARTYAQKKIDERPAGDPVAEHYFELAQLKLGIEKIDDARTLLQQAIALDSSYINAYISLANVHLLEGKMELAEAQMSLAELVDPNNPELFKTVLTYYVYRGDAETSQMLLQSIMDYDPTDEFAVKMKPIIAEMKKSDN